MRDLETLNTISATALDRLGFRPNDARDFTALVRTLPGDASRTRRVTELAESLRANVGRYFDEPIIPEPAIAERLDAGLDVLLALVVIAPDVATHLRARGIPEDIAWRSLSDLGQQVHVFRNVFGFFGISTADWCISNYTGRHLWLGRLQYTLERDDDMFAVGIHVPESGPLDPAVVDSSLAEARHWFSRAYPEFPVTRWHMDSWLLDPTIGQRLDSRSNIARFAHRFELTGESTPGLWAPVFFVFQHDIRFEPVDLSALPATTSLQRAMLAALDAGGGASFDGDLRPPRWNY